VIQILSGAGSAWTPAPRSREPRNQELEAIRQRLNIPSATNSRSSSFAGFYARSSWARLIATRW
jgi:hypothetical protein